MMNDGSGAAVYVLADYSPAGAFNGDWPLLVRFDDWRLVRAMYSYVARQAWFAQGKWITESCDLLSVVGGRVEFSTPGIRAWFVAAMLPTAMPPTVIGIGLGDGLLLAGEEAAKIPLGKEMATDAAVIAVRDDGMLVIEDDSGFALIDLTALVRSAVEPAGQAIHSAGS